MVAAGWGVDSCREVVDALASWADELGSVADWDWYWSFGRPVRSRQNWGT